MSNLDAALMAAQRGFRVFPLFYIKKDGQCSCRKLNCKRAGKHPITKNGCQDSTTDEAQIRQWWTEAPYANLGLMTGVDGLVVLDVDDGIKRDATGRKTGGASLDALTAQHGPLPPTLTVRTGGGGRHYYFLSIRPIPNSTSKVGPDLDIRGTGGYVILPPSNHSSGGHYEWLTPLDTKIADLPAWLEQLATGSVVDISEDTLQQEVIEDAQSKGHHRDKPLTPEQWAAVVSKIPADCDRDTWWRVGAALKHELGEERGFEIWDNWSSSAPDKYDSRTSRAQWRSFEDKGITGGSILQFARQHGWRGFDVEAADNEELKANWVYATSIKRFVEINRFMEWDSEQFSANFAPQFTRKPHEMVLRNPAFRRVDGVTYWPEQPLFVTEQGQQKLNYWRSANIVPTKGDVGPFLQHVRYLFPDVAGQPSEESRILLQYLAFQVQHPGEKVHWALLLEGEQGNGKSYFGTVMRAVLGAHNVRMVHNDQLHEAFSQWQRNTQLVIVEEMMARGRLELMNKLKPMITENYCIIREMYRPAYEQANRFNFLFFSNHPDSLILDSTDRRYCILKSEAKPHPDSNRYYGPLFDWTRNNAPALLHFMLHEVNLDGFQPKAHAPMTAGKRALIAQSMMPLDAFIYEKVEACEYPFHWDLHSTSALVEPLSKFNLRANPKEIGNALARLGYTNVGRLRVDSGVADKVYLWAVRKLDLYCDMSPTQLRQMWLLQQNGSNAGFNSAEAAETGDALAKQRPVNAYTADEAM